MVTVRGKRLRSIAINQYPFTGATYPGRRPRFSFLFTPNRIYRLNLRNLDRFLASRKLPPAGQRFAVLAYGSNACPEQLQRKYESYGLNNVPVLYGRLTGAEAVYARRETGGGYVPATLARKRGSRSSWITLLTAEQLRAMDASEGRPDYYVLAEVPKVQFSVGRSRVMPVYTYVDVRGGVMVIGGKPASLRSTSQKRAKSLLTATSREDAAKQLQYVTIPNPNPPERYSQFLR